MRPWHIRLTAMGLIGVFVVLPAMSALGQTSAAGQSTSVRTNAKGAAVAARAPGTWIKQALAGRQITATADDHPDLQQELLIALIDEFFNVINDLITMLDVALRAPTTQPAT